MFGGHRPRGKGDIDFSICHLTSRDQIIRGSSDIMDEFPSSKVITLESLVIIEPLEEEILSF